MLKQALLLSALVLPLPGCATYEAAERVSDEITGRSIDWLCNRMSVREWRETFARSREMMTGWHAMCRPSQAVPMIAPPRRPEPERPMERNS